MVAPSESPGDGLTPEEALAVVPAFRGLAPEHRRLLLEVASMKRLPGGSPLFVPNMVSDSMFVILFGSMRLSGRKSNGASVVFVDLHPGESFGELGLVRPGRRALFATALAEAELLEISRQSLLQKAQTDRKEFVNAIQASLAAEVARRLDDACEVLQRPWTR